MEDVYCSYYQAGIDREKIWFVVGALRNEDHIAFERALQDAQNVLEFFVPQDQEKLFLEFINKLHTIGIILWYKKQTNRFLSDSHKKS